MTAYLLAVLIAVSAPGRGGAPAGEIEAVFLCPGGRRIEARFLLKEDALELSFPGRKAALKRAISGSGARYVGEGIEFWNKGDDARVTEGGREYTCRAAPADGTAYYFGRASSFSPDGRIPYDAAESALKREILKGGALIRETYTRPGLSPSMPALRSVTELKRRGRSLVYDASDAGKTFRGKVAFQDPGLKAWTYKLKLKAGGELTGSGEVSADGLKTRKLVSGPGRPMSVQEDLKTVSESEYQDRLRDMQPPRGAE